MTAFDRTTAVTRVDDERFSATLDADWWVVRGPNGGYLAAILMRAMQARIDDPSRSPRSLTVHYLQPADEGEVTIDTTLERRGTSMVTLSARMRQADSPIAFAVGAFSASRVAEEYMDVVMPDSAPPESLPRQDPAGRPPIAAMFDSRPLVGDEPFSGAKNGMVGGWMRLAEPHLADAAVVALLADAWIPAIFPRLTGPAAAPTVDLTVHFRRTLPLPAARPDDYYLGIFQSRMCAEGFFEEDGELWHPSGVLVAQSRQLALVLPMRG